MSERDVTWEMINEALRDKKKEALKDPDADVFDVQNKERELRKRLKDAQKEPEITEEEKNFQIAVTSAMEMIDDLYVNSTPQDTDEVEHTILTVAQQVLGKNCNEDELQKLVERIKATPEIQETLERLETRKKKSQETILRHSLEAYLETRLIAEDVSYQDIREYEHFVRRTCKRHEIDQAVCDAFLTKDLPEWMIELAKELLLESVVNKQMKEHLGKLLTKPNIDEFTRFYRQNDELIDMAIPQEKKGLFIFIVENHLSKLLEDIKKPTEHAQHPDDIKKVVKMLGFYIKKYGDIDRAVYAGIGDVLEKTFIAFAKKTEKGAGRIFAVDQTNEKKDVFEWMLQRKKRKGATPLSEKES